LIVVSGSYAITGTPAILELGKPYIRGTYGITGTDAGLSRSGDPVLSAEVGSYVLTGNTGTRLEAVLVMGTGDYNVTGTAASLSRGKGLGMGSGPYSIAAGSQAFL
jgi:hypothetical protein